MRGKISLAFLILLTISALTVYVFAQAQTRSLSQPERLQEQKQELVKRTILVDKVVITLFQAKGREDVGSIAQPLHGEDTGALAQALQRYRQALGRAIVQTGMLRIELTDGSVQEIPISSVKEVTIQQLRLPAR